MKKIVLFVILFALLALSSCKAQDAEKNDANSINKDVEIKDNQDENKADEDDIIYREFDYEIVASDWAAIDNLSGRESALNFLSSLCLSDKSVLGMYLQGDAVVDELLKIKADALISDGRDIVAYYDYENTPHYDYEAEVLLKIKESESDLFPVGEYEYTLRMTGTSAIFTEYFCPTETYKHINSSKIEEINVSSDVYDAYRFAESFFRFNQVSVREDFLNPELHFDSLYHIAIHDLMGRDENFIFSTTLDEFKEYAGIRYGITDDAILTKFTNRLKGATYSYAECDENGVYTGSCAHGYATIMREVMDVTEDDEYIYLTYNLYADSARMVPCAERKFIFKKNGDGEILTLTNIESVSLNDLDYAVVSP